jgi:site-specific DNA recombinase
MEIEINNNSTNLIAGLYARVSSEKQEQEQTIDSQIDEIASEIERDGNILSSENTFIDDGWSGTMLERPSLDKMRDAAKEGRFQILYVYDRGRLSRVFVHQKK